jgi:hypothetical protein
MMRFLSLTRHHDQVKSTRTGFLAVDLGGFYTTVAAGLGGLSGTVMQDKFPDMASAEWSQAGHMLVDYASEAVTREDAEQFLSNYVLIPAWVPATRRELALSQAFARYRLRRALERFSNNYSWFDYHPERGLQGQYEPIIVCGGVLTSAPDPYGLTLTLLDGIQPYGITTLVLDRYNVLSLLGEIGETEPVLPVHLLSSATFENLGTVVSAAGRVPAGKTALSVQLETASGETGSLEVPMGSLTRLDIPPGETAELELIPHHHVDIGFGGYGHKGRLRVRGGTLGVIIDARGRPVQVPELGEARVALIQQWLRALGPNHD